MNAAPSTGGSRWGDAWLDAVAFAGGLAVAWYAKWETTDLVWSLWLSSLVVGYGMIVWSIFGPALVLGRAALGDRSMKINGREVALGAAAGGVFLLGGLFILAFFTFHFGMFHFVHSVFLNGFFPVNPSAPHGAPGFAGYATVFQRYWLFLPLAFLAERQAFRWPVAAPAASDTAVTAEAIAARKRGQSGFGEGMMAPYKNVVRMHLLIFFFAFAHFAKIESFAVYAVVYAVYFFPWRVLRRATPQ